MKPLITGPNGHIAGVPEPLLRLVKAARSRPCGGILRADTDHGIAPLMWVPRFLTLLIGLWTPWYHVSLACRFPALPSLESFYIFFFLLAIVLLIWKRPHWSRQHWDLRDIAPLGLIAIGCGLLTAFLCLPNDDDFSYYHRVLYQLLYLNQPFFLTHTGDNVWGLPALSIVETATSYEPMVGLTAYLLHIPALWAYQTGTAIISGAVLPIVYFALYRKFRLPRPYALAATVLAMVFFVIDGGPGRTFGNMAFVHIWEGKAILWTIVLPLIALYALDFITRPGWGPFAWLFLACVSSTGLSNSGTYMPEVLLIAIALCYWITTPQSRFRPWVAIGLLAGAAYPAGYAFGLLIGLIPEPSVMSVYTDPHQWPNRWSKNIGLVIPTGWVMLRDLVILIALPLAALRRSLRVYAMAYFGAIMLLALNPIAAAFWMKHILPANYWRLTYLLPIPWSFGLLACWVRPPLWAPKMRRRTVAVLASLVLFGAFSFTYWTLPNGQNVFAKSLAAPKLRAHDVAFLGKCGTCLHNQSLLAPEPLAVTEAMLDPTVRLECGRQFETYQVFALAHRPDEGVRREIAQDSVGSMKYDPRDRSAFIAACHDGIDRVIVPDSLLHRVCPYMQASHEDWQVKVHADGLNLYALEAAPATAAAPGAPALHPTYPGQTQAQ